MTSIIASATAYACAPADFGFDDLLFCSSDQDAAMVPLFCSKPIIQSAVCYLAVYSEITSKLFHLFDMIDTFQFIPRLMAVVGRMNDGDAERLVKYRGLQYLAMRDCIHKSESLCLLGTNHPLLKRVELVSCSFDDEGVRYLSQIQALEILDLSENASLSDKTPEYVARMKKLRVLNLAGCVGITYVGLDHLEGCANLRDLDLSENVHLSLSTIDHLPPLLGRLVLRSCRSTLTEQERTRLRNRGYRQLWAARGVVSPAAFGDPNDDPEDTMLWEHASRGNSVLRRIAEKLTYLVYLDISDPDPSLISKISDLNVLKEKCEFLGEVDANGAKFNKAEVIDFIDSRDCYFKLYHQHGEMTEAMRIRKENERKKQAEEAEALRLALAKRAEENARLLALQTVSTSNESGNDDQEPQNNNTQSIFQRDHQTGPVNFINRMDNYSTGNHSNSGANAVVAATRRTSNTLPMNSTPTPNPKQQQRNDDDQPLFDMTFSGSSSPVGSTCLMIEPSHANATSGEPSAVLVAPSRNKNVSSKHASPKLQQQNVRENNNNNNNEITVAPNLPSTPISGWGDHDGHGNHHHRKLYFPGSTSPQFNPHLQHAHRNQQHLNVNEQGTGAMNANSSVTFLLFGVGAGAENGTPNTTTTQESPDQQQLQQHHQKHGDKANIIRMISLERDDRDSESNTKSSSKTEHPNVMSASKRFLLHQRKRSLLKHSHHGDTNVNNQQQGNFGGETPIPKTPIFGEKASDYSNYLQIVDPNHKQTHAFLKRNGQVIHSADQTNLVGSATGQVEALLVHVVTPAGVIVEGEILSSIRDGSSYEVRCPLPDSALETKSESAAKRFRKGEPRFTQGIHEENIPQDAKPYLESIIRSVTPDGLTDGEIQRQVELEKLTTKKFFTAMFKRRDVLPFGFHAPSVIFNRLGRHTNLGLVVGWDATYFTYQIEQREYDPNFTADKYVAMMRRGFATQQDVKEFESKLYKSRIISAALAELQLPPSLSRGTPRNSYRVGSVVECRRYGQFDLDVGVVLAVARDVTYTVQFKGDEVIQDGILHGDVRLVNEARAEPCGVRDRVLVGLMGAKRATVIQCYPDGRFRAVTDDGEQLLLGDSNVLSVRPMLPEAVGASKVLTDLFDLLDESFSGNISWLKFRREILGGPWVPGVLAPLNTSTHAVPTFSKSYHYNDDGSSGRNSPTSRRQSTASAIGPGGISYTNLFGGSIGGISNMNAVAVGARGLGRRGSGVSMVHSSFTGGGGVTRSVAESRIRLQHISMLDQQKEYLAQLQQDQFRQQQLDQLQMLNQQQQQQIQEISVIVENSEPQRNPQNPEDGFANASGATPPPTSTAVTEVRRRVRGQSIAWKDDDSSGAAAGRGSSAAPTSSNLTTPPPGLPGVVSSSSTPPSLQGEVENSVPYRNPNLPLAPSQTRIFQISSSSPHHSPPFASASLDSSSAQGSANIASLTLQVNPVLYNNHQTNQNNSTSDATSDANNNSTMEENNNNSNSNSELRQSPLRMSSPTKDGKREDASPFSSSFQDKKHDNHPLVLQEQQRGRRISTTFHHAQQTTTTTTTSPNHSINASNHGGSNPLMMASQSQNNSIKNNSSNMAGSNNNVLSRLGSDVVTNSTTSPMNNMSDATSRRPSYFGGATGQTFGLIPMPPAPGSGGGATRSRSASIALPRLISPRQSLIPTHLFQQQQQLQQLNNNNQHQFGLDDSNNESYFPSNNMYNGSNFIAINNDSYINNNNNRSSSIVGRVLSNVSTAPGSGGQTSNLLSQYLSGNRPNTTFSNYGLSSTNNANLINNNNIQQPSLVSVISAARSRDTESAAMEKELQRQECLHDEVQIALDNAYEVYNAIKGIPPNGFHAGHDARLNFTEMAYLYEKIVKGVS